MLKICINVEGSEDNLTEGKIYEVTKSSSYEYSLIGDKGYRLLRYYSRFADLLDHPQSSKKLSERIK